MKISTSITPTIFLGYVNAFSFLYMLLVNTRAIALSFLVASSAFGQTTEVEDLWQSRYNGTKGSAASKVVKVDGQGNVLVSGSSLDPDGNPDFTVIKYEGTTGRELWQAHYTGIGEEKDGQIYDMGLDAAGNVYVVGTYVRYFRAYLTLVKYNGKTGQLLWQTQYDKYQWTERAAMAIDGAGNPFITGGILQESTKDVILKQMLLKYDGKSGQLLWQVFDDRIEMGKALVLDGAGYVYVVGGGGTDFYYRNKHVLTKYGTGMGKQWWQREYHTPTGYQIDLSSLAVDTKKNVYLGGQKIKTEGIRKSEWLGLEQVEYSASERHFILLNYAPNGNLVWQKDTPAGIWMRWTGEALSLENIAIATDKADNVYIGFREIVDATRSAYRAIKYAGASGKQLWTPRHIIQANQFNSSFQAMVIDAENNVIMTGTTQPVDGIKGYTTVKFDPRVSRVMWQAHYEGSRDSQVQAIAVDPKGNVLITGTNTDNGSAFLTLKYGSSSTATTSRISSSSTAKMATEENDIFAAESLAMEIYPIPAQYELYVSFMAVTDGEATLTFYDLAGKPVSKLSKSVLAGETTITIPTQHLPKGIYLLMFSQGTQNLSKKVVITH